MVVQNVRAADTEDLGWLRAGWLRDIHARTSTYAVVTAALTLLFALLGLFELFEDDISVFEVGISIAILVGGLTVTGLVAVRGMELPRWCGIALVITHAAVSTYYLGFSNERQNAIAALQELPIMAMYFSWFYGARIARIGELGIIAVVGTAAFLGPFVGGAADGGRPLLGPVNLVSAALFTWMCLEAGLFVRYRIKVEAHTDVLTGALNRRGFFLKAERELRRANRYNRPLCIALLDLDEFKTVNDKSGHAAGDDVLKTLTAQWMTLSRSSDVLGRIGGDEFTMVLPETDLGAAGVMLRRMRELAPHPWSWGVVQVRPGESLDEVLERADREMYDDKRGG